MKVWLELWVDITHTSSGKAVSSSILVTVANLSTCADYLGHLSVRRLHALLASPLLMMSSLSNFYFFTGTEVSKVRIGFVRTLYLHSGWSYFCAACPFRVLAMGVSNHYILPLLLLTDFHWGEELWDQEADHGRQGQGGVGQAFVFFVNCDLIFCVIKTFVESKFCFITKMENIGPEN